MATMKDLMANEEFLKGLVEVSTPAELAELLKNNDVQLEEGITIEEAFDTIKKQENAELSDADLDDVSGGIAFTVAAGAVACFVAGGAALSFLGGYAYQTYKNWKKKK